MGWKVFSAGLGLFVIASWPAAVAGKTMDPKEYVAAVSQSNAAEIKLGEMALRTSRNTAVKQFATEMVEAHRQSAERLAAAAAEAGLAESVADMPNVRQIAALGKLEVLTGDAFDREFAATQVKAHEDALKLQSNYVVSGEAGPLKTLASGLEPVAQRHLKMAQNLTASLKKK